MEKKLITLFIFLAIFLQYCKSAQTTSITKSKKNMVVVSYLKDVLPLMEKNCTPCHFPEFGKKKMLNTYETTKESINEILTRVQLPVNHEEFMPYKSKKPQLTSSEINLLKEWVKQNMPKE